MPDPVPSIERPRLLSLFHELVDIYSPSNKEEEIVDFLGAYLKHHGLPVRSSPVDDTRHNLTVTIGPNPQTLFLGHVDTVPAFDIEDYRFRQHDGLCYGLGTADMKGGCAAMIEGFINAHQAGRLRDDCMLALVVGEEETGDGTKALLERHSFQDAIVAEPTNLRPCLHHYGYVEIILRTFGARRHAAVSDRQSHAIRTLLRLLLQIEDRIELNEPKTVLNIRDLHSSESGFAVPDRCVASLDLHIPSDRNAKAYAQDLSAFVLEKMQTSGAGRYEIEFPTLADGFAIDPEAALAQRVRTALAVQGLPNAPESFKSHSDANSLMDTGCHPVIIGPGQLAKAHAIDESIDFDQVAWAAQLYTRLLLD